MKERIDKIKERFLQYNDWEDRYKELIQLGKSLDSYPEDKRDEKYKVKGCQSQVWLAVYQSLARSAIVTMPYMAGTLLGLICKAFWNSSRAFTQSPSAR